jgi:hypothetical protein
MAGDPLVQAQRAARAFVEGLAPIDSVALVTFGDGAAPVLNFTTDRGAVSGALDSLQAAGNTALYQATSVSAFVAASSDPTQGHHPLGDGSIRNQASSPVTIPGELRP